MAVNIYRVVIGTKTKMCQTFFIFEKKKGKSYGRNSK